MPSARFSAGGANSPRRYATTYATPEILEATWTAVPQGATGGAIEIRPYPTASPNAGGGFAIPAPSPATAAVAGETFESATYTDRFGNRRWASTPGENAWVDDLLQGVDELPDSPGAMAGRAAGGSLDDVVGQLGGRAGLGLGGVAAGAFSAYGEYQSGGGLASAAAVGVGAGLGSVAGAVVGGVAGSALGPVGTAVGSMIGGAIGQALGSALGDALIPDANINGAEVPGTAGSLVTGTVPGVTYGVFLNRPPGFASGVIHSALGPVSLSVERVNSSSLRFTLFQANTGLRLWGGIYTAYSGYLVRTDGGYDPALYDPNRNSNKPAYGTPEFSLPNVDLPAPGPGLRRPNLRWPFGAPAPTGEPNPTGDPLLDPTGYPYPDPTGDPYPDPTGDPAPYPAPTGQPGADGDDGNPGDDDNEPCDPCAKLDQVLELLQPAITGQIDLSPCPVEGQEPVQNLITVADGAAGIAGLSAKLDLALSGVEDLWELLRCQDEDQRAFPIPDSWELKKELNCPQLIIVCKKPGDKSSYRRSFSIPHPNSNVSTEEGAKRVFTYRRTYNRGSHLTQLVLKDNSKIKLTTDSRNSGQSLMDWLVGSCLDLSYQDSPPGEYRHGENTGWEIIPATVEFYTVCYYSQGKKSNVPDWIFTIPE